MNTNCKESLHQTGHHTMGRGLLVKPTQDRALEKLASARQITETRLTELRRWVYRHGAWELPTHHNKDPWAAGIGRWLHRLRQEATTGRLNPELDRALKAMGINLSTPSEPAIAEQAKRQIESTFERKFALLKSVIERIESTRGVRNITRTDSLSSEEAQEVYRYLAYTIRKRRTGALSEVHEQRLLGLEFSMNGTPFSTLLAGESMRLIPGGARGEIIFGVDEPA